MEAQNEADCKCTRIIGHLEAVRWQLWPREYAPSPGPLALGDWVRDPHVWLHYVESADGLLPEDDVLLSTDTCYWSIHDVQRYCLLQLHCEQVLFTHQYPNLRMPTRLGSYYWRTNTAMKLPTRLYLKEFHRSFEVTLKKMEAKRYQMDRLIISDQLIKVDRLDYFKRKTFFRILNNILSFQDRLQLVSFENLSCKRLEGARLLQQLACFNADSLKYLFLWRFVLPNENPILVNYSYITGSGQYLPRPPSRQCVLRSLGALRNLRVLALEYAHVADCSGGALLALLPVLRRPRMRLQLMCREEHIPGRTDAALGAGGYAIPDTAWRRVAIACPDLYLFMAFCGIRDYDNVRRFLSPSIPLREAHAQLGADLQPAQRQDSDVSCLVRHLAFRYASTLCEGSSQYNADYIFMCMGYLSNPFELPNKNRLHPWLVWHLAGTLSIHQWRFAHFPLRRVFELMPQLTRFFYVGRVQDEVDIKRMLQIIASGVCHKLKHLMIQIQDEEARRDYWNSVVKSISEEYIDIMDLYEINFCISIYKN